MAFGKILTRNEGHQEGTAVEWLGKHRARDPSKPHMS